MRRSSFPLFVTASPATINSVSTSLTTSFPSPNCRCTQRHRLLLGSTTATAAQQKQRQYYRYGSLSTKNREWLKGDSIRAVVCPLRCSDGSEDRRRRRRNDGDDDGLKRTISNVIVPSDGYPSGQGSNNNYDAFSPLKSTIETSFGKVLDELGNVMEGGPTFSSCRDFVTLVLYLKWCNVPAFKIIDLLISSTSSSSSSSSLSRTKPTTSSSPPKKPPRSSSTTSSHLTKPSSSSSNNTSQHRNHFVQPMIHHIYAVDSFCLSRERRLQDGAVASWVRGRVVGRHPMHAFSRSQIKRYSAMYRTVCDELPATVSWSLLFFNKLTHAAQGGDMAVDYGKQKMGRARKGGGGGKRGSVRGGRAGLPTTWEDLLAYIVLSCRYTLNS